MAITIGGINGSAQIQSKVEEQLERILENEQKIGVEDFKKICQQYLTEIDYIILSQRASQTIEERIDTIKQFSRGSLLALKQLNQVSHSFQLALNTFLGRKIEMTLVNYLGEIVIATHQDIINLYGSDKGSHTQGSGKDTVESISKVNIRNFAEREVKNGFSYFQSKFIDPQIKALQQKIDQSAKNRRAIFAQAIRRYQSSKNQDFASQDPEVIPTLYWNKSRQGNNRNWGDRISSRGYIGEGYVKFIIATANRAPNKTISFPNTTMQPPHRYNLQGQNQIRDLYPYAVKGDSAPGALIGDIKATKDGNIQLAVKQGSQKNNATVAAFRTSSILPDIGIALSFIYLHEMNSKLVNATLFRKKLQSLARNGISWSKIMAELTKIAENEIKKGNINIQNDLYNITLG